VVMKGKGVVKDVTLVQVVPPIDLWSAP